MTNSDIMSARRSEKCFIKVQGDSMTPLIQPDDILIIKADNDYKKGDIVVFPYGYNQLLIVHRILKFHNEYFLCKGDNSFLIERVHSSDIRGKVVLIKRLKEIRVPPIVSEKMITLSLEVNKEYRKNGYDFNSTIDSIAYKEFMVERNICCVDEVK